MNNMDLLHDLQNILISNKDDWHELDITVTPYEVKVILRRDPLEYSQQKDVEIPIVYDVLCGFVCIPDGLYRELFNIDDEQFGINIDEIKIIYEIMNYLESNNAAIEELCDGMGMGLVNREKLWGDKLLHEADKTAH